MHCDFIQGQVDKGLIYWPNHPREPAQTRRRSNKHHNSLNRGDSLPGEKPRAICAKLPTLSWSVMPIMHTPTSRAEISAMVLTFFLKNGELMYA
jgi:hypothetical protein